MPCDSNDVKICVDVNKEALYNVYIERKIRMSVSPELMSSLKLQGNMAQRANEFGIDSETAFFLASELMHMLLMSDVVKPELQVAYKALTSASS